MSVKECRALIKAGTGRTDVCHYEPIWLRFQNKKNKPNLYFAPLDAQTSFAAEKKQVKAKCGRSERPRRTSDMHISHFHKQYFSLVFVKCLFPSFFFSSTFGPFELQIEEFSVSQRRLRKKGLNPNIILAFCIYFNRLETHRLIDNKKICHYLRVRANNRRGCLYLFD